MLMGLYIKMVLMVGKEQSMTSCHLLERVVKHLALSIVKPKQSEAVNHITTYLRLRECTIGGVLRKYDFYCFVKGRRVQSCYYHRRNAIA